MRNSTVAVNREPVASMKALPKRKGNCPLMARAMLQGIASMKALPKRKGNRNRRRGGGTRCLASMKALPKRKGNASETAWDASLDSVPQ